MDELDSPNRIADPMKGLPDTDAALLGIFEEQTLPREEWTHRAHLRVAWCYLVSHPYPKALRRMRAGVQAFNAAKGIETTPTTGYHETLTVAWLRLLASAIDRFGPGESSDGFLDAQSQLLEKKVILSFYSRDRILSQEARYGFVDPDLAALPEPADELRGED